MKEGAKMEWAVDEADRNVRYARAHVKATAFGIKEKMIEIIRRIEKGEACRTEILLNELGELQSRGASLDNEIGKFMVWQKVKGMLERAENE